MAVLQVRELDTNNRRDVRRWVRLPYRLYAKSKLWVPPLSGDARAQLGRRRFPFYRDNEAAFFVASRGGADLGRICAMQPAADNRLMGRDDAYFYLFECVDEQAVADALFEAGAAWARQRGLAGWLRGPLGFMAGDAYGLLVEGFERRVSLGMPYNHAYYPKLVEGWGFELEFRLYSGYMDAVRLRKEFPEQIIRVADKVKKRYGFEVQEFRSKRALRRWIAPRLGELYEKAFTHVPRDRRLTREQVDAIARRLMLVSDPRLLKFITKDGEIIGFLFTFLDVADGIRRAKGRLWPFGWLHILWELRRTRWVSMNGIGMLPEYQGMGGTALLYAEIYRTLAPVGRILHAEAPQIAEHNHKSLNEAKLFGTEMVKTHAVYRKTL